MTALSAAPHNAGRGALRSLVRRAALPALLVAGYALAIGLLLDVALRVWQ